MIAAAALLLASQASPSLPAPVVVTDQEIKPKAVSAISWTCTTMRSGQSANLSIVGEFPAVSVEAQQNGQAYHLETTLKTDNDPQFNGKFPSALTHNILGISDYSIMIPGAQIGRPKFVLTFRFFAPSHQGFLNVLQTDSSSGQPSAYAAGLCKAQVTQ